MVIPYLLPFKEGGGEMVMRVVCIPHTDNDVKGSGMEWIPPQSLT